MFEIQQCGKPHIYSLECLLNTLVLSQTEDARL